MSLELCVRDSLTGFIWRNLSPDADLSVVDKIVLDYLISVLEDIGEDDDFDVDEFIEVMTAYIPAFEEVGRDTVYSWLFDLAAVLADKRMGVAIREDETRDNQESCKIMKRKDNFSEVRNEISSCEQTCQTPNTAQVSSAVHKVKDIKSDKLDAQTQCLSAKMNQQVETLHELFPMACSLQLTHCLSVANGDLNQAVQLMLLKSDESDEPAGSSHTIIDVPDFQTQLHKPSAKRQELADMEKEQLKSELISRYSYVDVESDQRIHHPVVSQQDKKVLVRYRDNLVVTTKGERIYMEKPKESEDMKKTYVNLKPARKYRFH